MILGIMGGMGSRSTCDLFQKIIDLTDAHTDRDHLHIIIDNNTQIPDRTEYILGSGEDPRVEMIKSAIKLEMMGIDYMAIPCNTAHYFYDDIVKYTNVKIIHVIKETAIFLKKTNPNKKDYLLLSTKGTYKTEIYQKSFDEYSLNIIEPDESDKEILMDWIYGVKSSNFDVSKEEYESLVYKYIDKDDISVILGCTELPLLAEAINIGEESYINPTLLLAKKCVELAKEEN